MNHYSVIGFICSVGAASALLIIVYSVLGYLGNHNALKILAALGII